MILHPWNNPQEISWRAYWIAAKRREYDGNLSEPENGLKPLNTPFWKRNNWFYLAKWR